jgi:hypothetical protein
LAVGTDVLRRVAIFNAFNRALWSAEPERKPEQGNAQAHADQDATIGALGELHCVAQRVAKKH